MTKTQRTIKRKLGPTDLSCPSDKAIEYGLALAQRFGAHLTLLYVFREPYAAQYVKGPSAAGPTTTAHQLSPKALGTEIKHRCCSADLLTTLSIWSGFAGHDPSE